uniref:UDP-N-acetylglucosamine 2-epimerase domain-containing protein n=1 Tax=viral metagenome TaxID=1070528 RepID=A0A6C0IG86_9ZZZZ
MVFFSIIFGTRPEYLKLKPIINIFEKEKYFNYQVIYIQQHETIVDISDNSYIKLPINILSNHRMEDIGIQILSGLQKHLDGSTHLIIQGDTASVFYSALYGFQNKIKVIHIEAGLRTYDLEKPYPEEAYRQMVSRIASYHFTPHIECEQLLKEEKVCGEIYTVGNTILDLIKSYNLKVVKGNKVLITFHRRENWDKVLDFIKVINGIANNNIHLQFIWYLHPNKELQKIVKEHISSVIMLEEPMNHIEFSKEIASCYTLLTDSGGIQEEASFLGKQTIVLRKTTERNHIQYPYIQTIESFENIEEIFNNLLKENLSECNVYGNGNSSERIYELLKSHILL